MIDFVLDDLGCEALKNPGARLECLILILHGDPLIPHGFTHPRQGKAALPPRLRAGNGSRRRGAQQGEGRALPPGKLALVPESDPRPPVDLNNAPDQEFAVLTDPGEE